MRVRYWLGSVALALVASACNGTADDPTTTTATASTTTTFAPIEVFSVSTTVAPGVDPAVHEQLDATIGELVAQTQTLRGLSYIQLPEVRIVAPDVFSTRLAASVDEQLDDEALDLQEAIYRLLGQYDSSASLDTALRDLYTAEGALAFYEMETSQIVVDGSRGNLTPFESGIVVRALTWSLLDQYHNVVERLDKLESGPKADTADAFRTLAVADTIATQLRYLQGLSEDDQVAAALQAMEMESASLTALPGVVRSELALPGQAGVAFVDRIVAAGGYAALDLAYNPPPQSTEQILHPESFGVRETIRDVPKLEVEIDGYQTVERGSYGEWSLRLLLDDAVPPGLATQTAAGWGGDRYQLLRNGDEFVFVYIYGGDTEDDTIEVAQALLAVARGPIDAGDGIDSGGGVLWEGAGTYVFVDRIGDGLMFVVATDGAAGAAARNQVRVP